MIPKSLARAVLVAAALFASLSFLAHAAGPMFYVEVPHEGRIYVFASGQRYDAWDKGGRLEMGAPSITRLGFGPNGETVVFDSEDAVNLYNYKHDRPGEYFPQPVEKPKSPFPAGKFSGLMFGDYYAFDKWHADQVSPTNTSPVEGNDGFWMRRIYFTYDLQFNEKLTTRFRVEANSNGQFAGGNLEPFVKDAFVKWTYAGKHQVTLGIEPSLTFDWLESFWGMRHIEKTPADLYRIDSSRDFGVVFNGPLGIDGLSYGAQFGNESGQGSETDDYKIVRFECRYDKNPGLALEVFYSKSNRPADADRTTAQAFAGYRTKAVRGGIQYLFQEREAAAPATADQEIDIWSGFVVWDVKPQKADVFLRYDTVEGDLDGVETGLPGAGGIDYLILSPDSPFDLAILGGEYFIIPSIRVGPNVEWVKYDHDPDPVNFPGRDEDVVYRATFYWTF